MHVMLQQRLTKWGRHSLRGRLFLPSLHCNVQTTYTSTLSSCWTSAKVCSAMCAHWRQVSKLHSSARQQGLNMCVVLCAQQLPTQHCLSRHVHCACCWQA